MPLRDAAALVVHGEGQHVPVIVQVLPQQSVDLVDHLPVASVPGRPIGGEPLVEGLDLVVGDGLDGHIADAHLIGVVGAAPLEAGAVHAGAAFHAHGDGNLHQPGGLEKFPRTGNGIVVDDAGGAEALHPGRVDRRRGRIGGEGIGGVDVVIDVLRDHGRELGGFQNFLQVRKALRLVTGIELFENGKVDHGGVLS